MSLSLSGGVLSLAVPPEYDDAKCLAVLRGPMGLSYAAVVSLRHRPGALLCNGEPFRTVDRVRAGDVVTVPLSEDAPAPPPGFDGVPGARLVYADSWLAVYDKPPHMPTHPSKWHQTDTLASVFGRDFGLPFRAVGRLDADTSGLLAVAKSAHAAYALPERLTKTYLALLRGAPSPAEGVADAPIAEVPGSAARVVSPDGQPAVTRYRVLAVRDGLSLAAFRLETGRTHQIRLHMANLGCPLVGDVRYGAPPDPVLGRHALHCARMDFALPDTPPRSIWSPPPFLAPFGFSAPDGDEVGRLFRT